MLGRPVSLDETIWYLLKGVKEEGWISELAGTWDMSESEVREIERCCGMDGNVGSFVVTIIRGFALSFLLPRMPYL